MSDSSLGYWIETQFKSRKELFKTEKDEKKRSSILYSLAKLLRQYINIYKTKQGLGQTERLKAHEMTTWLEKELLKGDWSSNLSYAFDSILYARRYAGTGAKEGSALRSAKLTKSERKALDSLTKRAKDRASRGLGELDSENSDRLDVLRDLALLPDPPEMDQVGDDGGISDNGDSDS